MMLTFRGHRIYSSLCPDETSTMLPLFLLCNVHIKMKRLLAVKDFAQKQFFDIRDLWRLNC